MWWDFFPSLQNKKKERYLSSFLPLFQNHSVKGAFWGVLAGQATGITRLVLDFLYPAPGCGEEDTRPAIVARVHFTYFSVIVLAVTATVAMAVSFTTHAQPKEAVSKRQASSMSILPSLLSYFQWKFHGKLPVFFFFFRSGV